MRVLFVPYNENQKCCSNHKIKNGSIDKPIRISNKGYLIFESKAICKKDANFPKKILIRVSKKGDFYKIVGRIPTDLSVG